MQNKILKYISNSVVAPPTGGVVRSLSRFVFTPRTLGVSTISSTSRTGSFWKLCVLALTFVLAMTRGVSYALPCTDPDCLLCGLSEPCSCVSDCQWVGPLCTSPAYGDSGCDPTCCSGVPVPPNNPPVCSITSGPMDVMSWEDVYPVSQPKGYFSEVSDIDDDALFCVWEDVGGDSTFYDTDCAGARYRARARGTKNLQLQVFDGIGTCVASRALDVYDCVGITYAPIIRAPDGTYRAVPGQTYPVTLKVWGPESPPDFTYEPLPRCLSGDHGTVTGANPINGSYNWTAPLEPSSRGTTCYLNSDVSVNGTVDACFTHPVIVNSLPTCGSVYVDDLVASFNPVQVSSCDGDIEPVRLEMKNAGDPDGADTLEYSWSYDCSSGASGAIPGSGSTVFWNASGISGACTISVDLLDGFETTSCTDAGAVNMDYTYSLTFNVYESAADQCAAYDDPADGVSVTLSGYGTKVADAGSGSVTFENIGSEDTSFNVSVFYSPDCTNWHLNCLPYPTPIGGGTTTTLDVTPTACSTAEITVTLSGEGSETWEAAIDGDIYSANLFQEIECASGTSGGDFVPALLQFSDYNGPTNWFASAERKITSAFTITRNVHYLDWDSICFPETLDDGANCGFAQDTGVYSTWFDSQFSFEHPNHPYTTQIEHVVDVDRDQLNWMTVEDFNSDTLSHSFWGFMPYRLYDDDAILYVYDDPADGFDSMFIDDEIHPTHAESGRLLIITNADVNIDPLVDYFNYGLGGYEIVATPNVEAGIVTSGTITVEGGADPDHPVMLTGPLVAGDMNFERDLDAAGVARNAQYPAVTVRYQPRFRYSFTEKMRDPLYCSMDYTGFRQVDVQFEYEAN
jgi:hypothetical protein